jgi:trimeric autotransporter adhesin
VLFDGAPAPLLYAVENQLSAVVPYTVAGKSSTQVQVEYRGTKSAPVTLQVASASPGIFALDSSGKGPGAILNQDSSVNSPANPAGVGSVVSIFATGQGQTSPAGIDGKPASEPLARPILPVSVTIGGQIVPPSYAGAAPGQVAGLMQINVTIPAGAQTGSAVPMIVQVGNTSSQTGVTIAVR